jgi:hypothetical protein
MKIMSKKVKFFGRSIPAVAIALIAIVALASAGLLTMYGKLVGTAEVHQSVKLYDGTKWLECTGGNYSQCTIEYTVGESSAVAGSTYVNGPFNLKNDAQIPATVKLQITYDPTLTDNEITTTYRGVLDLTDKVVNFGKTPWAIKGDKKATIWYTLTGDKFDWGYVSSSGFDTTLYTLIYYKDNSNRFDSPAKAIKVSEINGSLPYTDDANVDEYDYCGAVVDTTHTGDNYVHCHGAKLWLVPTTDINLDGTLKWEDASNFLFETDLISYTKATDGNITLPANGGGVNFEIVNSFAINIWPGTYTITTEIKPA